MLGWRSLRKMAKTIWSEYGDFKRSESGELIVMDNDKYISFLNKDYL